jgi:hypothetical protein
MPPRGGVVTHVERQAAKEVGELAPKQREVRAAFEVLTGIQ